MQAFMPPEQAVGIVRSSGQGSGRDRLSAKRYGLEYAETRRRGPGQPVSLHLRSELADHRPGRLPRLASRLPRSVGARHSQPPTAPRRQASVALQNCKEIIATETALCVAQQSGRAGAARDASAQELAVGIREAAREVEV